MKMPSRACAVLLSRIALVVCFVAVTSAWAGDTYEFRNRNVDNDYLGATTWKTNFQYYTTTQPGSGDRPYVTSGTGHDVEVTVTNDVSVDYEYLVFKAQKSSSFKFYTTGNAHAFEMPYSEGGMYETGGDGALFFQNGNAAFCAGIAVPSSHGPCCSWTDPYFTMSSDSEGYSTVVFSRGTFDFLTPGGYDASANTFKMVTSGSEMLFGTNVVVKLPKVSISHEDARLLFRGSRVALKSPDVSTSTYSFVLNKGYVEVSDNATLSAYGIHITGSPAPMFVVSNAVATFAGNMKLGISADGKLIVKNGGSLSVAGADALMVADAGGNGGVEVLGGSLSTPRIRLSRATATAEKTAYFLLTGGTATLTGDGIQFQQSCTDNNLGTHYVQLDGGVLEAKAIFRAATVTAGTAYLSADGGRYKARETGTSLAYNLSYAEFGAKGLTVDTGSYSNTFAVDGRNKAGANGVFVKDGSGTLTLAPPSSWTVSHTVVSNGTLKAAADATLATALELAPGATFSTVGSAAAVTLDSLAVTNATLALDAGDVITVTGSIAVRGLTLNWSSVPSVATPFLVVSGEMDEGTKAAIRAALFANALSDGTHASYTFNYDAGTGKTTASAYVAADEPLTDSVTWTGSGAWATPGNWEGNAAPTDAQIASFTSASAGKTVTVVAGDKAGALVFGADGYTLTGTGPLTIKGEIGAAQIAANAGAATIDVPLNLSVQTAIPVAAGASLAITQPVSYGGIAKTGTGKLTLGADNLPESGISSADGILEVTAGGALGASVLDNVALKAGTVQFAGANGAALHVPANISVAATSSTDLVVFKADTDTTLDALNVTQGAICKRGVGRLTVNVPANTTYTLAKSKLPSTEPFTWFPANSTGIVFPADGTAPDSSEGLYPGFSVAEGELAFVGMGPGAQVYMNGARLLVGLYAKTCAIQPMLTVDNVYCDCRNNGSCLLGHNVGINDIGVTNPVLRIVNGGTVCLTSAQMGYGSTSARSFITVAATNGTFQTVGSGHFLTRMWNRNNSGARAYYRFKDSRMYLDGEVNNIGGGIDLDFDNSVLATSSGGLVALTGEDDRPCGTLAFRNGSMFAYGGFTENSINKNLTFAFDDAELLLHQDRASATLAASTRGYVHYEMRGAGAVLKPASGATYTINAKMEGTGGLVVDGEGTVAFGANAAQFTGTLDVRQGTADFSANGGAAAFTAAKGAGTVSGAAMDAVTLPVTLLDDGTVSNVLTLADCTLGGRVTVDFGRTAQTAFTAPYPRNLLVARYSGATAPAAVGWRMAGSGFDGYRGKFTFADGEVRMTVLPAGFAINFR